MTLNLNPEPASSKKDKNYKKVIRVGSLVSLVGLGSTFAANISLNAGDNVEFGQGVAQTAACDEDGFSITPRTQFDNARSMFRLDRLEITGLNLTPVGTGYQAAGYNSQSDAKTAHPGQYYDNGDWKRTCDGVVLDFKAYTDSSNYAGYTLDSHANAGNTSIASPVGWTQWDGLPLDDSSNHGVAVQFEINDGNDGYATVFGVNNANSAGYLNDPIWVWANGADEVVNTSTPSDSSFYFIFDSQSAPRAEVISKIAVASMSEFPADYLTENYYA